MIPDDDSVRAAMHRIEPASADATDLFDRVAAGALGRRRRAISVVSAAAVVVAIAALIPALGHGGSSTRVHPLGTAASPNPLLLLTESPLASPPAVASSPALVQSPTPEASCISADSLCAGPAGVPGLPVASGSCAPGLTLLVKVGSAEPQRLTPGANSVELTVGELVTFSGFGPCNGTYDFWPEGPSVFGASEERFGAVRGGDAEVLAAATVGSQVFDIQQANCDGCATEAPGTPLATLNVIVRAATAIAAGSSPTATASPLPEDASGCPTVPASPLAGDAPGTATQEAAVVAAAIAAIPGIYGTTPATRGFQVTKVYPASVQQGYGIAADGMCGKSLGDQTYVVEIQFPNSNGSSSIGNGQLFIAQFADGWQVWYRYH